MTQTSAPILEDSASRPPKLSTYLGVSLYWLAWSMFWGAMLALILPDRVEDLVGVSSKDLKLGHITSMGAFVAMVAQYLSAALSDVTHTRWGRRRPYLVVGTLLATVGILEFPYAASFGTLVASYIAIQLCLNSAIGPYQSLVPDVIPQQYHGRASAFMGFWTLLGRIGGPAMAQRLMSTEGGMQTLAILFAIILNAFMLANLLLIKEPLYRASELTIREKFGSLINVPLKPYPGFIWLCVSRFLLMTGVFTVMQFMLYYVQHTLGFENPDEARLVIVKLLVTMVITGMIGIIPAGKLSDQIDKKRVMYAGNIICIISASLFVFATNIWVAFFAVGMFGLGFGVYMAVDAAMAYQLIPADAKAKYLGVWNLSDAVPGIVAPLLAGPIAWYFNNHIEMGFGYRVLMVMAIVYYTIGTIAISRIILPGQDLGGKTEGTS